jgi:hypothetical protein
MGECDEMIASGIGYDTAIGTVDGVASAMAYDKASR